MVNEKVGKEKRDTPFIIKCGDLYYVIADGKTVKAIQKYRPELRLKSQLPLFMFWYCSNRFVISENPVNVSQIISSLILKL